jgi:hypothetical protein
VLQQWTEGFTWFGPPKRNILRPRRRLLYYCVWCCSSVEFNLRRAEVKRTCLVLMFFRAFYSSRLGSYNETEGPTGGPGADKTLYSRTLIARSNKRYLQQSGHALSCCLPRCTRSAVWCRAVESLGTVAVPDEWSIVSALHCSRTIAIYSHAL